MTPRANLRAIQRAQRATTPEEQAKVALEARIDDVLARERVNLEAVLRRALARMTESGSSITSAEQEEWLHAALARVMPSRRHVVRCLLDETDDGAAQRATFFAGILGLPPSEAVRPDPAAAPRLL